MPRIDYTGPDGTTYPGVTTVLDCLGLNREALMRWAHKQGKAGSDFDEARQRPRDAGSYGHALITDHLLRYTDRDSIIGAISEPDDSALDDNEREGGRQMHEAFVRWLEQADLVRVVALEANLVSTVYRCGGTPDVIFERRNGRRVLADWKGTSGGRVYVEHPLQLAGYGMLWTSLHPHLPVDEHEIVLLSREGTKHRPRRPWSVADLEPHRMVFMAALTIHHLRKTLDESVKRRAV